MRTSHLIGLTGAILLVVCVHSAQAQRGGFSPEFLMDRLDQDGNGRIDRDEMSESRIPIADMAERAGVNTSRGLDADDLQRVFEQMQRSREEEGGGRGGRGGFGGGGDFGGPGAFGGGPGGFGGGFGGFDRGSRSGFDRGGFDRGGRGDDRSRRSSREPEPPPRVTMDLQSQYLSGDTNADGQIAMSEWLRWKGRVALAEFLSLDRNADGILTPRELSKAASAMPVDLSARFPSLDPAALGPANGSPVGQTSPTMDPQTASTSDAGASGSTTAPTTVPTPSAPDAAVHISRAKGMFKILDRNRDGSLTAEEWTRSPRLRPMFENAGVDLTEPMSEEQFATHYVKIQTAGSSS